jgi:ketosteroid isomerase-like protein
VVKASTKLAAEFLEAMNLGDMGAIETLLAEDAVYELPYAPEQLLPRAFVGRGAIVAFMATASETLEPGTPGEPTIRDVRLDVCADDPGEVVAEWRSDVVLKPTGSRYRNRYIGRFTVRDGRISRFVEYHDPITLLLAFGGSVEPPALEPGAGTG